MDDEDQEITQTDAWSVIDAYFKEKGLVKQQIESFDEFVEVTMQQIIDVHYPSIMDKLVGEALNIFYQIRDVPGLKKKPSTSEVLDWLKLILAEDLGPEDLRRDGKHSLPRLHGALLKNEQDVQLFERLAFLSRSGRG